MIDIGIEVTLPSSESFLILKETLERCGIASRKNNMLYQSAHILHRRGQYFIVHFKELFALDGKRTDLSRNDLQRRNTIARLLEDWGLLEIVNPDRCEDIAPLSQIKIISHRERSEWILKSKYTLGKKRSIL